MHIDEFSNDKETLLKVINKCNFHAKYVNLPLSIVSFCLLLYFKNDILFAILFSALSVFNMCLTWLNFRIRDNLIEVLQELDRKEGLKRFNKK
jgi:hypothetical protein